MKTEQSIPNKRAISKVLPHVIGMLGEDVSKTVQTLEIKMAKNVSKLMTDTKSEIQEAQRIQSKTNTKNAVSSYIMFQMQKPKTNKMMEEDRGTKICYL